MESFFNNQMVAKTTKNWASGGLVQRVGADSVGYQESGNTSGFVHAKRTFLRVLLKDVIDDTWRLLGGQLRRIALLPI